MTEEREKTLKALRLGLNRVLSRKMENALAERTLVQGMSGPDRRQSQWWRPKEIMEQLWIIHIDFGRPVERAMQWIRALCQSKKQIY